MLSRYDGRQPPAQGQMSPPNPRGPGAPPPGPGGPPRGYNGPPGAYTAPPPNAYGGAPSSNPYGATPPPGGPSGPYGSTPPPSNPYGVPSPSTAPLSRDPNAPGAPAGLNIRKRNLRQVELTAQGNLVIDVPVPDKVRQLSKYRGEDEFIKTRYTACTVDADHFATSGYSLRQQELGRKTEIFIVVTMYNEGDDLFCKTMVALFKNIAYLCQRSRSSTWGEQGWKNVVICIVSDGRTKINPRVLNVLGLMGVYQDGIMKNMVNDKEVKAHLFEFTTQIAVDTELNVLGLEQGFVPVQVLFCLKEKNAKKINSHRWFFNAFGQLLRPNVCILIDVGTKPSHTSIYHLWKVFDRDPKVGGACGEIYAELGPGCCNLINPLVAAQNFEYKMSNILDKPLESVFGFIAVLPGAFSAYRFAALQGVPLQQYFKGETMHGGSDIFAANMYLAEDRILCFELVTKAKEAWVLRYVKAAKAETDVPATVPEFISQRRRWLNGSFFAGLHSMSHWYYIFRSGHGPLRQLALIIEMMYNFITTMFAWFSIANFFLAFYFLGKDTVNTASSVSGGQPLMNGTIQPLGAHPDFIFYGMTNIYLFLLILVFVCSLGNRPQGSKITYTVAMVLFAGIMGIMLYLGIYDIVSIVKTADVKLNNIGTLFVTYPAFKDMVLSVGSTYALYFLASFLYFEPWHMFTSFIQYMFLLPSYVNILMVGGGGGGGGVCNLHDVSWGTKGDNGDKQELGGVKTHKGKDGKEAVEIDVPSDMNDINAGYDKFVQALRAPRPDEKAKRDAKTKQDDYFKNFRTRIILWWLFSNGILMAVMTSTPLSNIFYQSIGLHPTGDINPYLKFIFFSVLGLSAFRFVGSVVYLITTLICEPPSSLPRDAGFDIYSDEDFGDNAGNIYSPTEALPQDPSPKQAAHPAAKRGAVQPAEATPAAAAADDTHTSKPASNEQVPEERRPVSGSGGGVEEIERDEINVSLPTAAPVGGSIAPNNKAKTVKANDAVGGAPLSIGVHSGGDEGPVEVEGSVSRVGGANVSAVADVMQSGVGVGLMQHMRALFLADLTWWTTDEDLITACRDAGVGDSLIEPEVAFLEQRTNGKSRGIAFMLFKNSDAAATAKDFFERIELHDTRVTVTMASTEFGVANPFRKPEDRGHHAPTVQLPRNIVAIIRENPSRPLGGPIMPGGVVGPVGAVVGQTPNGAISVTTGGGGGGMMAEQAMPMGMGMNMQMGMQMQGGYVPRGRGMRGRGYGGYRGGGAV
ncbi:Chitin synthase, class 2, partial [Irineochytrium annulatum]